MYDERDKNMLKDNVYIQELSKLTEIFKDVDENKKKLVEGLIEEAAFLKLKIQF